jgi:isopentenyl diphosphate isomerase/L-lactate dehydrogenase-like FMN-dependent dehydrogenase
MPIASLINDIANLKKEISDDYSTLPHIIADGGIRGYSDAIKALALGSDYVMIGSVFAKMEESAAPKGNNEKGELVATFYGMASRQGQIALNGAKTKTSEGLMKQLKVEYTMSGWTKNFIDYLRSAMSYVGAKNLHQFRNSKLIINSQNAVNVVNK